MTRRKKIIIWVIVILVVLGGIGFAISRRGDKVEYQTEIAVRKNVAQTVSVTGTVQAVEQADLAFESTGTVKEIWVDVGNEVKKGQKIARIDSSVLNSQLAEAQESLAIQQDTLSNMRRHWDDYTPDEQDVQKDTVDKAAAAVNTARAQISKTVLRAPMDGIVAKRHVEPNEVATFGSTIVTIIKPGQLEIEADVPESDIAKVALGQNAEVELDAIDDEMFRAKIIETDPTSTEISDVVYYKVTLNFESNDDRFRDGMSADIDVLTAEKKSVIAVPNRAVKEEGGKKYVEILEGENQVRKAYVKTGLKGDDGEVEIISGVKEGEKVIVLKNGNGKK